MPIFSSFYFHDEIEHKKEAEKPKKLNNNFKKAPHFRKMWTRCSVFLVPRSKRYECTAVYILGPVLLLYTVSTPLLLLNGKHKRRWDQFLDCYDSPFLSLYTVYTSGHSPTKPPGLAQTRVLKLGRSIRNPVLPMKLLVCAFKNVPGLTITARLKPV